MKEAIVVGVPGPWPDKKALMQALLARPSPELLAAGPLLYEINSQTSLLLDLEPHNPSMKRAFQVAGQGKLPPQVLADIGNTPRPPTSSATSGA